MFAFLKIMLMCLAAFSVAGATMDQRPMLREQAVNCNYFPLLLFESYYKYVSSDVRKTCFSIQSLWKCFDNSTPKVNVKHKGRLALLKSLRGKPFAIAAHSYSYIFVKDHCEDIMLEDNYFLRFIPATILDFTETDNGCEFLIEYHLLGSSLVMRSSCEDYNELLSRLAIHVDKLLTPEQIKHAKNYFSNAAPEEKDKIFHNDRDKYYTWH